MILDLNFLLDLLKETNDSEDLNKNKEPNKKSSDNNIGYNVINSKPVRRTSLLKSPKRNSLEFSETKIIEELNAILKTKFIGNNLTVPMENEIILNVNVRPFHKVN